MRRVHLAALTPVVAAVAGVGVAQSVGATTGSASMEVRKMLVPSTDSGKFNLIVRHTGGAVITQANNVGNNGHTSRVAIPAGEKITVEETAGTGSKLGDYSSVLDCVVISGPDAGTHTTTTGTGRVLIPTAGDRYTCTFTNTRTNG
jgi:hypothetical protein